MKPEVLNELLNRSILENINEDIYDAIVNREEADRKKLQSLSQYL